MADHLTPEVIQRHIPHPFEAIPPAVFLEHHVEVHTLEGRLGRKPTWNRLSFHSWKRRRVWLSGQERIVFGEPEWRSMSERKVAALIGREEMPALPSEVPQQDDEE
jgi:hypothetical protein